MYSGAAPLMGDLKTNREILSFLSKAFKIEAISSVLNLRGSTMCGRRSGSMVVTSFKQQRPNKLQSFTCQKKRLPSLSVVVSYCYNTQ